MENSTVHDKRLNLFIGILETDQRIDDDDFVYMGKRSLKRVPLEANINKIQKSLREKLNKELNNAGRKSLAERSTANKEFIKYKTFKLLTSQINKPRTCQTLLNSIPQQFSTSMDSLPNIVKEDMKNKGITKIPSSIHELSRPAIGMQSLLFIKYLTTQCMEIEFDNSFETLEEEYQECSRTIFIEQSQELLHNKIDCINTLNILHDIWKNQDPLKWNTMTLQPATQPCLNNSSENFLLDQQHESTLPIDADAGTKVDADAGTKVDANTGTKVDAKAKELTKSAKRRLKNRLKAAKSELPQTISPKQPAHPSPAKPSSETSTSGKDTPITEKATEQLPSQSDKTPSKEKSIPESKPQTVCPLPKTTLPKQASSASSQGAIPKKATSSASSQGARPKEKTASELCHRTESNPLPPSAESIKQLQYGIEINNQKEFNALVVKTCLEIQEHYVTRENAVKKYIDNPNDEELYHNAVNAFNFGFWPPGQLFDLLTDAYAAGQKEAIFAQKIALIKIGAFSSGYPPTSEKGKPYMKRYSRDLSLVRAPRIRYLIEKNITPSEALDSCFNEFMIADSGIIVSLVIAKTLKHYWGEKRYNKYFNTEWKDLFQINSHGVNDDEGCLAIFINKASEELQDNHYVEGNLYQFLNHHTYLPRDFNGQYYGLCAFCTDAKVPLFCVPELFENASLHTINEKLVNLFNKTPYNEKIMTNKDWQIYKTAFYEYLGSDIISMAVKKISLKDIPNNKDYQLDGHIYRLDYKMARDKKRFFGKKVLADDKKEMHEKEEMSISTKEVTPVATSSSFRPETPKTEKPSKSDKESILSSRKSNASGAIRKHGKGETTPEQVHKAFLAFETAFLESKYDNPECYKTNEKPYKNMKGQVEKIIGTDTP